MAITWKFSPTRYSRFGDNLGRLTVYAAEHEEDLSGTDMLTVTCAEELQKGERLVWRDRQSVWHEHIVDQPTRTHDESGQPYTVAVCINSISELWGDYITDKRPSGSAHTMLTSLLDGTRWSVGTCDVSGTQAAHVFYHESVREAVTELANLFGGEIETHITCDGAAITGRSVCIRAARGNADSKKRFTYTKDLLGVSREVGSANPITRVYGYGKGEETDSGGYGRRITFEAINGGLPYVEDAAATAIWGHYDANGNVVPECGTYVNEDCDDPAQLLAETQDYLDEAKTPQVSYKADVIDLAAFGREWEEVGLGDSVLVIDKEFAADGLRLSSRITGLKRDLLSNDTQVSFGTLIETLTGMIAGMSQQLDSLNNRAAGWNGAASVSSGWLDSLMSGMNAAYDAAGTYQYSSFEKGLIFSNVPLDANGNPTRSGGMALNIVGGAFRLADETNADGSWKWRAFGNGSGFTADEINAGTIRANLIKAGILQDAAGVNYWDMENGTFRLTGSSTTVDGKSISTADTTITAVSVEYAINQDATTAPTSGWSTAQPTWQDGYYIWTRTATTNGLGTVYSTPACITGAKGETGATGTGVSSVTITYGTSDSASAQPSSWSSTAPTSIAQGKWLWCKTVTAYTDSSSKTTYTKSYIGTDGDDGKSVFVQSATKTGSITTVVIADTDGNTSTLTIEDGQDGATGTAGASGYVHTAWANSADGTTDFSTTVSANKQYLGVYTDNTAADSTTPSDYSWSLIKGATGTGVSALQEQYYLSTSDQTQEGGSWSTAQPTWSSGHYIWTRTQVTWTDSSVTYTSPVLAKAINGANEAVQALNTALTQQEIFNRLTNNGQTQGIYLENGLIYINGQYIKADTIQTDKLVSEGQDYYLRLVDLSSSGSWGTVGAIFYNSNEDAMLKVVPEIYTDTSGNEGFNSYIELLSSIGNRIKLNVDSNGLYARFSSASKSELLQIYANDTTGVRVASGGKSNLIDIDTNGNFKIWGYTPFRVVAVTAAAGTISSNSAFAATGTISTSSYDSTRERIIGVVGFTSNHNQSVEIMACYRYSDTQIRFTGRNVSSNNLSITLTAYVLIGSKLITSV